jgi:PTH2 family peptidyl-tRNA hydrolase
MFNKIKKMLSDNNPIKQALVVRKDLKMSQGKLAAQCSHASVATYLKIRRKNLDLAQRWVEEGMKKIVLRVDSEKELLNYFTRCKTAGIPCELIKDAGHTQIKPGTTTCFGAGPWNEKEIDKILGKLKLL